MSKKVLTDSKKGNLEQKIIQEIKQGDFSVERALLIASGLTNENQINVYIKKIEITVTDFKKFLEKRNITNNGNQNYQIAKTLFEYLQKDNLNRYNNDPLLTNVIDNQLSKNKKVGNCNGLTSLYTVLGLRLGLNLSVLFNDYHILTLLEKKVLIDHVNPRGFDISFRNYSDFKKGDLVFLISATYNHRGTAKKDLGDFEGAIADCDKAIEINSKSASAYYNRSINKASLGNFEGAIADCDKAIELNPKPAYYTIRGNAKNCLGDLEGAIADQDKAIELDPEYAYAYNNRGIAKKDSGDFEGAIADYSKAIELNQKDANSYYNRSNARLLKHDFIGMVKDFFKYLKLK